MLFRSHLRRRLGHGRGAEPEPPVHGHHRPPLDNGLIGHGEDAGPGALYHPVIPFTPVGIHRILTKISQIISVFFVRFVVYFLRQVEEARQCRNLSFLLNRGCSVDAPEPPGQSAPKPQSGFVPPPARAAFFYAGFRTNVSRETFRWFSHLQKGPLPFIIVPHDLIWRSSPCP